jgi:hypothetical protein
MSFQHGAQSMSECLDLRSPRQRRVDVAVDLGEHAVDDQVLELFFAPYVAVQGAGDHPEACGQGAHGQRFDAVLGDQRECLGHHTVPGQRVAELLIGVGWVEPQRAWRGGARTSGGVHLVLFYRRFSRRALTVNAVHVIVNIAA